MWTPKRVVLLASGFVLFCAAYVGYAKVLGSIDGLPALPDRYCPGVTSSLQHNIPTEREVEVKLQQAFGTGCQELKMPIQVESPRGVVIASNDCTFERGGREVVLKPISIAFFGKQPPPGKEPEINTIRGQTAILTLDQPISGPLDMGKRRIVAAELRGFKNPADPRLDVPIFIRNNRHTLRQDDDIQIKINVGPVFFNDEKRLIHTDDDVELRDLGSKPETKVTGTGLDVHLSPSTPAGDKPAPGKPKGEAGPTTVERIVLLSNVDMHLYNEPGSGFPALGAAPPKPAAPGQPKPDVAKDHIWVTTGGKFTYDVARNHARFDIPERESLLVPELVTVRRNPADKTDTLECDHLELQFRRKGPEAPAQPAAPPPAEGQGPNLEIEWVHAWGGKLHLNSEEQHVKAWGNDLVYNAPTHTTTLKGDPEALLTKDEGRIRARELEMIQETEKGTQHVTAHGKGSIHLWDKDTKKYTMHARWYDLFVSRRDGTQDHLTFKGNAALVEDEKLLPDEIFADARILSAEKLLKADELQIWLDPPPPPPAHPAGAPPAPVKPAAPAKPAPTGRPGELAEASGGGRRPRHVEAKGHVIARSPEMAIREQPATRDHEARYTERLSIFFTDIPVPVGPPAPAPTPAPAPAAAAVKPADAPPTPPGPEPIVVPGAPTKPEPAKPDPQPAKPPRPVQLWATFIKAHVLRYDGTGKTELDQLDTEGAVQVVQEPSPEDNGFTIRGEKLALKRKATGNHLKVNGNGELAEMRMDRLNVVGPEIEVDQGDNTATVEGDGFMQMENTTDFQGNPLKKPEWLTVHWNKLMRFEGSFAEFAGNIQAQQGNSRLTCQTLQVYFDKPVTLGDQRGTEKKQRPNGEEPARAKKLVCDKSVKVEEETYEVRYKLTDRSLGSLREAKLPPAVLERLALLKDRDYDTRDRFIADFGRLLGKEATDKYQGQVVAHATYEPAPRRLTGFKSLDCLELMVENLERSMSAAGPGVLRIVQPGGGGPGAALGGPTPKKEPAKPGAKPAAKPAEEWTLTLVNYGRFGDPLGKSGPGDSRMDADNNTHTAVFYEDVHVLHIPWTSDPRKLREPIDMAATVEQLPPGGLYMECRKKLKVYSPEEDGLGAAPAGGGGKHVMTGIGQVYLKATDAKNQVFWGNADVIHYFEEKEQVIFDGGEGLAEVYQVERRGAEPKRTVGKKIIYWRKDGRVEVDNGVGASGSSR